MFDTIAGQTMLAAGGAMTAKAVVPSSGAKATGFAGKAICKRSAPFNNELFDSHFAPIQDSDMLPKSLTDLNLNTDLLAQPENLVATLYTVFMILKLVTIKKHIIYVGLVHLADFYIHVLKRKKYFYFIFCCWLIIANYF